MPETKSESLVHALDAFIASSPDVEATAVVSFDGLTMASALPADMEDDRVGAMSAALLGLGEQAAQGLGRGNLQQLIVEADRGFVFLMSARDQAVLVAITGRQTKLGFILYEMRRAARVIGDVLDPQVAWQPDEPEHQEPVSIIADVAQDHEAAAPGSVAEPEFAHHQADSYRDAFAGDEDSASAPGTAHPYEVDTRGPIADPDLDDPYYVSTNGRNTGSEDHA